MRLQSEEPLVKPEERRIFLSYGKRRQKDDIDLEQIDMSLGLTTALPMLKHNRMSGLLQAEVNIPNGRDRWLCCIYLIDGEIVSCAIRGKGGQECNVSLEIIAATDYRKGPFAWSFVSQQAPPRPSLPPALITPSPTVQNNAVPFRLKNALDQTWLASVSEEEKRVASWVFGLIDGRRSVAAIKALLWRLPAQMVERVLVFLIATAFINVR